MILWLERTWGTRVFFRPCREVTRLSSESVDRSLSLTEQLSVRIHLFYCRWCGWYLTRVRTMHQHFEREEMDSRSSENLSPQARQRILQAVSRNDEMASRD
ncbi:MAG TPA: zf-HC2 domain-containing protein [Acidobacteriota bacterium]|nr:zf-HC2 domain-containing protein [Acidobacteriota bacterium]